MRNNLADDRATQFMLVRIFGESEVNVVVRTAKQIALHALSVTRSQRVVLVNIRVPGIEHVTNERDDLSFAEFCAAVEIVNCDYIREFRAARGWLTFWNRRFVVARIVERAESIERHLSDRIEGCAEVILLRILLIVGRVPGTAGVAAQVIDSLRLVCEWS